MKISPLSIFRMIFTASILTIGGASAQSVVFSFGGDTWNYASGPSTLGFVSQTPANSTSVSSGSVTKSGLTVKFGASFVGGATSGANFGGSSVGSSLSYAVSPQNPAGFLLSSGSNDSSGLADGTAASINGGNVDKYQRWHFEFSSPILIDNFIIQDIDNLNTSFRDILGAEAYTSAGYTTAFTGNALNVSALPVAGSGIDATFGLNGTTSLANYSVNVGSQNLSVLSPNVSTGNPNSTPAIRANVTFGATPIKAFSLYSMSNMGSTHRMSLDNGVFSVTVVPEPSAALLALVSAFGILRRRR